MARPELGGLTTDEASKCADQVASRLGGMLRDQGALTVDRQHRIKFRKEQGGNKPYKTVDSNAFSLQLRLAASASGASGLAQPSQILHASISHAQPSPPPPVASLQRELARVKQQAQDELESDKKHAEDKLARAKQDGQADLARIQQEARAELGRVKKEAEDDLKELRNKTTATVEALGRKPSACRVQRKAHLRTLLWPCLILSNGQSPVCSATKQHFRLASIYWRRKRRKWQGTHTPFHATLALGASICVTFSPFHSCFHFHFHVFTFSLFSTSFLFCPGAAGRVRRLG
jgi:hypothetical protein